MNALLIFFLALNTAFAAGITSRIELAWDEQPGVVAYELELKSERKEKPLYFKTAKAEFSQEVPARRYVIRVRSYDQQGAVSEWGNPISIDAFPPSVELINPKNQIKILSDQTHEHTVSFSWRKKVQAHQYILLIWNEKKVGIKRLETQTTSIDVALPIGQKFHWKVLFKDQAGVLYESAQKTSQFLLVGDPLATPVLENFDATALPLKISWQKDAKVEHYVASLSRRDILGTQWVTLISQDSLLNPEWRIEQNLHPGEYELKIQAKSSRRQESRPLVHHFLLKPKLTDLAFIKTKAN